MALSVSSAGTFSATAGPTTLNATPLAPLVPGRRRRGSAPMTRPLTRPTTATGVIMREPDGPLRTWRQSSSQAPHRAATAASPHQRRSSQPAAVFSHGGVGVAASPCPAGGATQHPNGGVVQRLPPPAATGAASGGPVGHQSPNGQYPTKGQHFNPRYHMHRHQHHQQQQSHQHQSPHANQHQQHQQHPGGQSRGAWSTPGPLAPGSGGPGGGTSSTTPAAGSALPSSVRTASAAPAPQPTGASADAESRRMATGPRMAPAAAPSPSTAPALAATAACPAVAPASVSAAARRPPKPPPPPPHDAPGPPGHQPPPPSHSAYSRTVTGRQSGRGTLGEAEGLGSPRGSPEPGMGGAGHLRFRTQLEQLYIKDFALVSEQTVRLGPGVNVITGESGSGKSVLVEAFSQVLGAPAPQECVRAPAEAAVIEATFLLGEEQTAAVLQLLTSCGLPQRALAASGTGAAPSGWQETAAGPYSAAASSGVAPGDGGGDAATTLGEKEGEALRLMVRREIAVAATGGLRSRVYLNGYPSSLRVLRELGALLVDTNGQHSSMSLRDSATQLDLLDRIAGTGPLADSYCSALGRLRAVEERLDELDELDDEEERARMQKLVDAVAKLRVQAGEDRELRRMLKKMEARRSAVEQCGLVRMALCGEGGAGGVTDALRTIEAQLNAILAQEEQNRAAAARAKGKDSAKAVGDSGDTAGPAGTGQSGAAGAGGEDEAGEEEEEEGEEGEAAVGVRLMEEALDQVAAAKDMLAAAETMVRSYARRYQFSQADHDATSERLARIDRLMRQASAAGFGGGGGGGGGRGSPRIATTEQLLEAAAECSSKLASYYEMEGQREEWEAQVESLALEIRSLALRLSVCRRAAAAALRSAVEGCLRDLAMGGSRFDVRIGWTEERLGPGGVAEGLYVGEEEAEEAGVAELGGRTYVMGPRGLDQVEFLLAAGPAEPLRPLAAVASGGESARVMLALKAAPAQAAAVAAVSGKPDAQAAAAAAAPIPGGGVPIMILDELDSGIGARLGSAVGSILSRMSLPTQGSNSQIICVTHLPQVACYAAHHIKVQKELRPAAAPGARDGLDGGGGGREHEEEAASKGRVTTSFQPLVSFEERCEEVAAMLGLDKSVAEEMLCTAQGQVAALYPPGEAPNAGLLAAAAAVAATAASPSQSRAVLRNVARAAAISAGAPSGGASPRDEILRVVQDTLRNDEVDVSAAVAESMSAAAAAAAGDVGAAADGTAGDASRASFVVSVSPAMDPNAVVVGGASAGPPATDVGMTGGGAGVGRRTGGGGGGGGDSDDSDAEEADLSAKLLAGVEAAALEHLARMEAQAKAAAAAAAAAAAIVGGGEAETVATMPVAAEVSVAFGGSADAEAEAVQPGSDGPESGRPAEGGLMAGMRMSHGGPRVGGGGNSGAALGVTTQSAEETEEGIPSQMPIAAAASRGPTGGVAGREAAAPGAAEVSLIEGAGSAGPPGAVEDPRVAAGPGPVPAPASTQDAAASGFVVAVQPSRSPLPYIFGSTSSTEEDDDNDPEVGYDAQGQGSSRVAAPAATAATTATAGSSGLAAAGHNVTAGYKGEIGNGNGYEPGAVLLSPTQSQPQSQSYYMSYDSPYVGAGMHPGTTSDSYTYNLATPGGRFVVVPMGQENEFTEMFATIMAFSRDDYATEAMRSYEATLWQALEDSGLA